MEIRNMSTSELAEKIALLRQLLGSNLMAETSRADAMDWVARAEEELKVREERRKFSAATWSKLASKGGKSKA